MSAAVENIHGGPLAMATFLAAHRPSGSGSIPEPVPLFYSPFASSKTPQGEPHAFVDWCRDSAEKLMSWYDMLEWPHWPGVQQFHSVAQLIRGASDSDALNHQATAAASWQATLKQRSEYYWRYVVQRAVDKVAAA
eukprot:TRINITY_DN28001_c0_g2_i4.p1 TRINITY_DN28001_c0_g2~~TRINITY_DN28001_c0_g2_i4.p1  ORF type:complete len:136 (-),score=12.54 TRINITY_DN28001_c0_g2_i4:443-850(-)